MRTLLLVAALALAGCETLKPYEKEFLLNPLMDDQSVTHMQPAFMSSTSASFERLSTGSQSTGGSACPTCGG